MPLVLIAILTGCAAMIPMEATLLVPARTAGTAPSVIRVSRSTEIHLPTGYTRTLAAGSRWNLVGSIAHGSVYRSADAPFSVEGRHVHEAYLVIHDFELRGFYLPVEARFSPLSVNVSLPLGGNQ